MAISSFHLLIFLSALASLSLIVDAAEEVSQGPPLRDLGPASASARAPFQHLYHVATSYLALVVAGIRDKYQRTLHAQLGFMDMVQLVALCSIVQAIRLWCKRSRTQKDSPATGHAGPAERRAGGSTKASSRDSFGSSKRG